VAGDSRNDGQSTLDAQVRAGGSHVIYLDMVGIIDVLMREGNQSYQDVDHPRFCKAKL